MKGSCFHTVALLVAAAPVAASNAGVVPLTSVRVASGLSRPVDLKAAPGTTNRLYVCEQHTGRVKILNAATGVTESTFLDIDGIATGNEQGLLGIAFHPDFANNGQFFVNLTISTGTTHIRRYTALGDPTTSLTANLASAFTIMTYAQPFTNHNGGWIEFGPDGYLYIAAGDGGSANDPGNRAQDITLQRLGKILRIDVDSDAFPADPNENWAAPVDNPFVGVTGDDEIWHYGLRNPWRCSFDSATGDLYIGDVGQGAREEISFQPAGMGGLNYGWRCMEGIACTGLTGCTCNDPALELPIHDYTHAAGACSVTGGYVYRGCNMPAMHGVYFFADFCNSQIWSFRYDGVSVTEFTNRTAELTPDIGVIGSISSFGTDALGEIYICDLGGEVFKILPESVSQDCNSNLQLDSCDIASGYSRDLNANNKPDECEEQGTPFCFGDGTGVACPCFNFGLTGEGCLTTSGRGMLLTTIGTTSISTDDLMLVADNVPLNNTGIFYAATNSVAGNLLYDGIQCAVGNAFRFQGQVASTSTVTDTNLVAQDTFGLFFTSGTTYYFHYFSRDNQAGPSPCGGFANLSNSVSVVMTP
jgi:glucose/arabinose dehydrogenase